MGSTRLFDFEVVGRAQMSELLARPLFIDKWLVHVIVHVDTTDLSCFITYSCLNWNLELNCDYKLASNKSTTIFIRAQKLHGIDLNTRDKKNYKRKERSH